MALEALLLGFDMLNQVPAREIFVSVIIPIVFEKEWAQLATQNVAIKHIWPFCWGVMHIVFETLFCGVQRLQTNHVFAMLSLANTQNENC